MSSGALYMGVSLLCGSADSNHSEYVSVRTGQHMASVLRGMAMGLTAPSFLTDLFVNEPNMFKAAARHGLSSPHAHTEIERMLQIPMAKQFSAFPGDNDYREAMRFWSPRALATELFTEALPYVPSPLAEGSVLHSALRGVLNTEILEWALQTAQDKKWDKPIRLISMMLEVDADTPAAFQVAERLFSEPSNLQLLCALAGDNVSAMKRRNAIIRDKQGHLAMNLAVSSAQLLQTAFSMTYGSAAVKMSKPMPVELLQVLTSISEQACAMLRGGAAKIGQVEQQALVSIYGSSTTALARLGTKHCRKPALMQRLAVLQWVNEVRLLRGAAGVEVLGALLTACAQAVQEADSAAGGGAADIVCKLEEHCEKDGLLWVEKLIRDSGDSPCFAAGLLSCIKPLLMKTQASTPGIHQLSEALKPLLTPPDSPAEPSESDSSTSKALDKFTSIAACIRDIPILSELTSADIRLLGDQAS